MSASTSAAPPTSNPSSAAESSGKAVATTPPPDHGKATEVIPGPASPPLSSPSFPSSSSRQVPSQSTSASHTRTTSSPPTTTRASTSAAGAGTGAGAGGGPSTTSTVPPTATTHHLNPTLPSQSTQLHIAEARAALVASVSNLLDNELQSRASLLHSNAAALTKQEKDVAKATEALRKENDKLAKVARDAGRQIKELGNVQNWAEVLERDFLVLEETMRLVRGGGNDGEGDEEGDESGSLYSGSSYWSGSGSDGGSREGSRRGSFVDEERRREVQSRTSTAGKDDGWTDHVSALQEPGTGTSTLASELSTDTTADEAHSGKDRDAAAATKRGVNASIDDAILASLTEAMATDMYVSSTTPQRDPSPVFDEVIVDKGKAPDLGDSKTSLHTVSRVDLSQESQTAVPSTPSTEVASEATTTDDSHSSVPATI